MLVSDKGEFLRVLNGLAGVKRVELTPEVIEIWWSIHESWDIADFKAAASHLLTTCEFMPCPRDFAQLRKAVKPTVGEAWCRALDHAASSKYRQGPLNDPLIDLTVRALGGYQVIAMCADEKLGFLERRFAEHYETMSDAEEARGSLPQIAGPSQLGWQSVWKRLTSE